jgi:hypothetical protein
VVEEGGRFKIHKSSEDDFWLSVNKLTSEQSSFSVSSVCYKFVISPGKKRDSGNCVHVR